MTNTSTCAHGVDLNAPCTDCQNVCAEIDRTGATR